MMNRNLLIQKIHIAQNQLKFDDGMHRDLLQRITKKRSCKDCSDYQLDQALKEYERLGFKDFRGSRANQATGKYASVLRAIWLSGYNLGVVRSKDDAALIAFVQRQSGVSHTRFLTDSADARKAIEGLKQWISREAGFEWPSKDTRETKKAIVKTQWLRLADLGSVTIETNDPYDGLAQYVAQVTRTYSRRLGSIEDPTITEEEFDKAQVALGKKLRTALMKVKAV